jgi:uncharacterized membrane protein
MLAFIAIHSLFPIPYWSELHPLIIHFPIVLLLIAPLFIVAGMVMKPGKGRPFLIAALALMLLGTASAFLAVSTGEAAGEVAEGSAAVSAVLEHHEDLAHTTQIVFTVLTFIFATTLFLPRLLKREMSSAALRVLLAAFLLFYAAGAVILVNTAHNGGRLVHEFGVHAGIAPTNQAASEPKPPTPVDASAERP